MWLWTYLHPNISQSTFATLPYRTIRNCYTQHSRVSKCYTNSNSLNQRANIRTCSAYTERNPSNWKKKRPYVALDLSASEHLTIHFRNSSLPHHTQHSRVSECYTNSNFLNQRANTRTCSASAPHMLRTYSALAPHMFAHVWDNTLLYLLLNVTNW